MPHRHTLSWSFALLALLALVGCMQSPDAETESEPDDLAVSVDELSSISCTEHTDTGYRAGSAFPISVVTVDGRPVEIETANAYYVMAQAASRAGVEIRIVSGFRTMAEQEHLYYCYTSCSCNSCNLAARPGRSNHQSGRALDLNTRSPGVLAWLNAHADAYGFSRTVASEVWHWELTGRAVAGGPCHSGCEARCEGGTTLVGDDCGRGDCGAFGARCVDDALGARCVFGACPARGTDTFCVDDRTLGTCHDGAVGTGDCGAYGARCVDDALGARCVFGACPARGNSTVCLDETTLATCSDGAVTTGDCGAFGARCADGPEGAHCAFYACPDNGEASVCLDQRTIAHCDDGAVTTGDCGAFAAVCSTEGTDDQSARCVSLFCVADPSDTPVEHDTCLPDGRIAHCDENGSPLRARECRDGTGCEIFTRDDGTPGARCAGPDGEEPTQVEPTEEEPTESEPTEEPYEPEPTEEEPGSSRPRGVPSSCAVSPASTQASGLGLVMLLLGLTLVLRRRR